MDTLSQSGLPSEITRYISQFWGVNRDFSNITESSHVFEELSRFVLESDNQVVGLETPYISKSTRYTTTVAMSVATGARANVEWRLLYRASEYNCSSREFHRHCDGEGPTITLVKAANGRVAGAYAGVSWDRLSYFPTLNPSGFIVQITGDRGQERLVKYCATNRAEIWDFGTYGPSFTSGFTISHKCDVNNYSYSLTSRGAYVDGFGGTEMDLFGADYFVVDEYEVYQIVITSLL